MLHQNIGKVNVFSTSKYPHTNNPSGCWYGTWNSSLSSALCLCSFLVEIASIIFIHQQVQCFPSSSAGCPHNKTKVLWRVIILQSDEVTRRLREHKSLSGVVTWDQWTPCILPEKGTDCIFSLAKGRGRPNFPHTTRARRKTSVWMCVTAWWDQPVGC